MEPAAGRRAQQQQQQRQQQQRQQQQQPASRLRSYQPAALQELCVPAGAQPQAAAAAPQANADSPGNVAWSSWQRRKAAQRLAREEQARRREEAFRAAMERKRAADAAAREAAFQQLCDDVIGGMQQHGSEGGILSEVQQLLEHAEAQHRTRQQQLHAAWHSQVFDTLQARLQAAVAATPVRQLEAALADASAGYLHALNTKLGVYRDILGGDYDPLAPLARSIRVPTGDLADPLLQDLRKAQDEAALLQVGSAQRPGPGASTSSASSASSASRLRGSGAPGAAAAAGTVHGLARSVVRDTLDTRCWAAGQIHATPHGHCIDDRTAEYIVKPAAPQYLQNTGSRVVFDDFSPPPPPQRPRPGKRVACHEWRQQEQAQQ